MTAVILPGSSLCFLIVQHLALWLFPASDVVAELNVSVGCAERWGCGAVLSKSALTLKCYHPLPIGVL